MSTWHETPEAYVVGAALLDPSVMDDVGGVLSPQHFGHAALGRVYTAALKLWEGGESFTLADVLGKLNDSDLNIAEEAYSYQATAADVLHFATQVRKEADRREIQRIATEASTMAKDRTVDPAEVAERAATSLHLLSQGESKDFTTLGDGVEQFYRDLQERSKSGGRVGIETPFPGLDERIGGWEPGLFYIIGARPSVGKSAIAVQVGMRAAKAGARVLYVILETSRDQWLRRVVSSVTGVSTMDMKRGEISQAAWPLIAKWCGRLSEMGDTVTLWDAPTCTPAQLRSEAMRLQRSRGLDMILVDYVQLMEPGVKTYSRQESMAHVSRQMVSIAKSLDVSMVALAQLGRQVQGDDGDMRSPVLKDLKESGAFEQDASAVLFLHRRNLIDQDAELTIAKQRDGPVGRIYLNFDHKGVKFTEVTKPGASR